jgi:DNA-binding transcriptional ArsR family regulator
MHIENKTSADPMSVMAANAERAEAMLKMLANRHRLMILCTLVKGRASVSEINESVALSQSALSQHLAKLREEGIVSTEKRGQLVYYHITDPRISALLSTLYLIYCQPQ